MKLLLAFIALLLTITSYAEINLTVIPAENYNVRPYTVNPLLEVEYHGEESGLWNYVSVSVAGDLAQESNFLNKILVLDSQNRIIGTSEVKSSLIKVNLNRILRKGNSEKFSIVIMTDWYEGEAQDIFLTASLEEIQITGPSVTGVGYSNTTSNQLYLWNSWPGQIYITGVAAGLVQPVAVSKKLSIIGIFDFSGYYAPRMKDVTFRVKVTHPNQLQRFMLVDEFGTVLAKKPKVQIVGADEVKVEFGGTLFSLPNGAARVYLKAIPGVKLKKSNIISFIDLRDWKIDIAEWSGSLLLPESWQGEKILGAEVLVK